MSKDPNTFRASEHLRFIITPAAARIQQSWNSKRFLQPHKKRAVIKSIIALLLKLFALRSKLSRLKKEYHPLPDNLLSGQRIRLGDRWYREFRCRRFHGCHENRLCRQARTVDYRQPL